MVFEALVPLLSASPMHAFSSLVHHKSINDPVALIVNDHKMHGENN